MSDFETVARQLRAMNIRTIPVVVAMSLQDDLPEEWRVLIYKYGQTKVFGLIQRGFDLKEAIQVLAR